MDVDAMGTPVQLGDPQEHQVNQFGRQGCARRDEVVEGPDCLGTLGGNRKPISAFHCRSPC